MSVVAQWLALSRPAVERIHAFVFDPASYLHPDRVPEFIPERLRDQPAAVVSRALLPVLGAADALDLAQPAQRAALLPADGLARVAVRLGVQAAAATLKRVVMKDEVGVLSQLLAPADWRAVYESAQTDPAGAPRPDSAALAERITNVGWLTLQAACDALPAGVGQRLKLKLPRCTGDLGGQPMAACAALAAVYADVVTHWDAGWDACFAPPGA